MIASDFTLRVLQPVVPFCERTKFKGFTYGVGPAGYDIRINEDIEIAPGEFKLASSFERFKMPDNLLGVVHDKSTWARVGLCVQNTVIEPGWEGFLTLELTNHSDGKKVAPLKIQRLTPIAQVIFHILDYPTSQPYKGKYQDQASGPQEAIFEE